MTQPHTDTTSTHRTIPYPRSGRHARRMVALVASAVLCISAARADARLFFDPADGALAGATTVVLDASLGLAPNVRFAQTVQNGVEITFTTTNQRGLSFTGATLAAYAPDGAVVEFDPPVGAVAFSYQFGECFGIATFVGAAGGETFSFPFAANRQLVGASAIGDIARVTLNDGCFASGWTDLRFVPGTGTVPTDEADLSSTKTALGPYVATATTSFAIGVRSAGPDTATGVQVADFLPALSSLAVADVPFTVTHGGSHDVATLTLPDLAPGAAALATVEVVPPPFGAGTFCESQLINLAITTAGSLDPSTGDNVAIARVPFDRSTRFAEPEVCTNAFDDDCDGRPDCADSSCRSHPHCAPPAITFDPGNVCWGGLQVIPGVGVVDACGSIVAGALGGAPPPPTPGSAGSCSFPTRCAGTEISVSPHCCDPPPADRLEWLQRATSCIQEAVALLGSLPPECVVGREDVGALSWMGMPVDPNYKEADPPVNVFGHGYTDAGRTMTYRLHYENVGTADAHDVAVIDPLPDALDDSTLQIADGGVFDPVARTITWLDPVVPPHEPRSVGFSVAVRSDAPLGTRIRNVGTVVFPDAVPPTRIDTNFVEHVIPVPEDLPVAEPVVLGCTANGPGEWRVRLANFGAGFAYGVTATIVAAPSVVSVSDPSARFSHPDDLDPATLATVMPASSTISDDTVALAGTAATGDPCETLLWRVGWQNAAGQSFTRDVRPAADTDADGVSDARDDCPANFDPLQLDRDGDGRGDACDGCPDDATTSGACPTPTPAPSAPPAITPSPSPGGSAEICGNCRDDDGDGRIDLLDDDCTQTARPLDELDVKRGVLSLAPRADRDGVTVRGTFPAPDSGATALDPPAQGVTVSFFAGDRLIACFVTPPGEGWKRNFNGRLWQFRDRRDDSLADPETDERLRLKLSGRTVQIAARFKDVVLRDRVDAGEITTTVQVGPHGFVSTDRWRERPGRIRLVTP